LRPTFCGCVLEVENAAETSPSLTNSTRTETDDKLQTGPAHLLPFKEVIAEVLKVKPPEKLKTKRKLAHGK